MKKIVAIVLFSALLFLGLVSCGTEKPDSNVASGDYVRPDKKTFSEIEQTTLDYYYGQMIQRYPSFAAIPREMLMEKLYYEPIADGGIRRLNVSFIFCIGGLETGCEFSFYKDLETPEGEWAAFENGLSKYYTRGLTEAQMTGIRSMLCGAIKTYIEENNMSIDDLSADSLPLHWYPSFEGFYLVTELDANPATQSPNRRPKDQAHVRGEVLVNISTGEFKLVSVSG